MSDEILRQARNLSQRKTGAPAQSSSALVGQPNNRFLITFDDPSDPNADLSLMTMMCRDAWVDFHLQQLVCSFEQPQIHGAKFINGIGLLLDATLSGLDDQGNSLYQIEMTQLMIGSHTFSHTVLDASPAMHQVMWDFVMWQVT